MLKMLHYYILFICQIVLIETSIRVVDKGILPLEKNSVAIQFYFDIENQDKLNACKFRSRPKLCCLSDNEDVDCDIIAVYGDYHDVLEPKYRDTVLYIYPTMAQHDQVGYCSFLLEHRCGRRKSNREAVRIPFDTRLKIKSQYLLKGYANGLLITPCETLDQDSLDQCSPVNCDVKYSGNRPFYDTELNKCVKAVECFCNPKQQLPDIVYEPKSNTCRDLNNPLTIEDIYAISTGLNIITESPERNEFKVTLKSNCSTISQNLMFLKDLLYGKLFPMKFKTDFSKSCNTAILSILTAIIGISLALLIFILCFNITAWAYKKWSRGELMKEFQTKIQTKSKKCKKYMSEMNYEVKNKLLKEVIVSDLPLELRDSVSNFCDQIGNEVRWKKKWMGDVGSQEKDQNHNSETSITS